MTYTGSSHLGVIKTFGLTFQDLWSTLSENGDVMRMCIMCSVYRCIVHLYKVISPTSGRFSPVWIFSCVFRCAD